MTPQLTAALSALKSTDPYAIARARALLIVYDEVWADTFTRFKILEVEHEFQFPLLNPESESASRTFDEAGKIDILAERIRDVRLVVFEHKTTSEDVSPSSDYWDRLRMDSQISKYFLAAMRMGKEVGSVMYDVVGKPGQRPCQIPKRDPDNVKIVLDGAGNRVKTKDGKKWRESGDAEAGYILQTDPETPAQFETRLLEVLRAEPGAYFAQREVPRLDSDILEFMADDWSLTQQILYFRSRKIWPRNPQACKQFGTCEFFDLCAGRASVDGVRFGKRAQIHAELKIQGSADKQLLTNSRGNALRKCLRYHKLRYEDGVEKVGEEAEALTFGTLLHAGWEAYFNAIKATQPQ